MKARVAFSRVNIMSLMRNDWGGSQVDCYDCRMQRLLILLLGGCLVLGCQRSKSANPCDKLVELAKKVEQGQTEKELRAKCEVAVKTRMAGLPKAEQDKFSTCVKNLDRLIDAKDCGVRLLSICALGGCPGKSAQCDVLIEVLNSEGQNIPKISTTKPESFVKAEEALEKAAKRTADIELKDSKLVEFRDEYKEMLGDLVKATRNVPVASESNDPVKIKKAYEKMESFKRREADYLERLNAYCSRG